MNNKDFHKQMIEKQGTIETVNKTIQEHMEYIEALRDFKILALSGKENCNEAKGCMDKIQEERVDCKVMDDRINQLLNFSDSENDFIMNSKINRTKERYLHVD